MSIYGISSSANQYPVGTVASPQMAAQTSTSSTASTDTSSSIFQELKSFYQTRQADLSQLGSDLQSGNLTAAEQDFSALTALGQTGPFANSDVFSNASREQAFTTIGQDLQSGDLAGAQAAFATLGTKSTSKTAVSTPPTDDSSSLFQQLKAYRQERKADLAQLGQDLQAGNLTAALQDFNALTALGQSGPYKSGQTYQESGREQDLQAIGTALQSGDLTGAETAFASLSGTFGKQDDSSQVASLTYAAVQQAVEA
ncbi:MAG: hypothetical protein WCF68_07245 [Terriglobales bacterium]